MNIAILLCAIKTTKYSDIYICGLLFQIPQQVITNFQLSPKNSKRANDIDC